jgi:hypothetical protein
VYIAESAAIQKCDNKINLIRPKPEKEKQKDAEKWAKQILLIESIHAYFLSA